MTEEANAEMARRIAAHVYSGKQAGIPHLIGQGLVNHVYGVSVGDLELVVRFCRDEAASLVHQKEAWCIRQATEAGVPGPTVLVLGTLGGTSYMIQTFLEGTKGEEAPSLWPHIWRELGRYARLTHSITTQGFGGQLADAERRLFSNAHTPTWADFVAYNIASLTADDALWDWEFTPHASAKRS